MTANKRTPGPWSLQESATHVRIVGADGENIWHEDKRCPRVMDDARLVATAPELLEACQTFSEWLRREEAGFPAETRFDTPDGEAKWREWYFENLRVCDLAQTLARSAIAKATGEAP